MKIRFLALAAAAALCTSMAAQAEVEATLAYKTPDGTVSATDTIELWVTLSLSNTSDALSYDASLPTSEAFGSITLPATGNNYDTQQYNVPFVSYDSAYRFVSRNCTGTFANGCDNGAYVVEQGISTWFTSGDPFLMLAGESRDFLLATFTPTTGSAAPGTYVFHTGGVGFGVVGLAEDGTRLEASIEFQACPSGELSCSFTRTVTAVPEPSLMALTFAGLLSVVGLQRRRHRLNRSKTA